MIIKLQEPYAPRPIHSLELWELSGWRLKVYGIGYHRPQPRAELVLAAKELVRKELPKHAQGKHHYGVGFIGVHDGRGANFVFLDFWADENELHHHVYVSPADQPQQLVYATPSGLAACVWDLRVLCIERQAWLDAVLANPQGPDLEKYLAALLNEDI